MNNMRKKILISMFILAVASIFAIFIFASKKSTINIYVVPDDAIINVDGKDVGHGHITLSVTNGKHQINVTRDGYNTYSESFPVSKDASQTIILTSVQSGQQPTGAVNITPYSAVSLQPISTDTLIAIDSNNSNLIKIAKNGITTLYAKPVYSFSFVNPYVTLIEAENRDKMAVINIETGTIMSIDAKAYAPIISVSISSDASSFYFLGNYDTGTRNASLYTSPLISFSPSKEGDFIADGISSLPGNEILLTSSADAADSSSFSIYDTSNKKYLFNASGDGALVSPSGKNIAIYSSSSLGIISVADLSEKSFSFSFTNQKIVWADANTLLVLTNEFPGIKFYKIDCLSNSQTSESELAKLSQVSARYLIGVIANTLFLQDSTGKVWSVALP